MLTKNFFINIRHLSINKIKRGISFFLYYFFSFSNKKSFWFSTYNGRLIVNQISKILDNPLKINKIDEKNYVSKNYIDKNSGYLNSINIDYDIHRIYNNCNYIYNNINDSQISADKKYLSEIDLKDYPSEMKEFVKFGINKSLIKMVHDYFDEIPIINEIRLFRS